MRKAISALFLLLCLLPQSWAQPRPRDFREANDSLQQRMKRRTGVDYRLALEKVVQRGNVLDFYYSVSLSSYPWRPGDITWFRQQLAELAAPVMGNLQLGSL